MSVAKTVFIIATGLFHTCLTQAQAIKSQKFRIAYEVFFMAVLEDYRVWHLLHQCGFVDPTEQKVEIFDVEDTDHKVILLANKDRNNRVSILWDDTPD